MKKLQLLLVFLFIAYCNICIAQPGKTFYNVTVSADKPSWTYSVGENVKFTITVSHNNNPLKDCKVNIQIGPEQMPATLSETKIINGTVTIDGGTMQQPGFLRCIATIEVDGKKYKGLATAGFDPEKIKPTTNTPNDFESFWQNAIAQNQKIPLDPKLTLLPEKCTEKVSVYQLNIQNFRNGARVYGILSVPKKPGKYPAMLKVPGAGIRSYPGEIELAEKGMITLEIGIHGVPVVMDNSVYLNLAYGGLADYPFSNLDNKDKYYYKRVYLGCIKAVDYIYTMPEFDGKNMAVYGGSQGGALSIVTAALDKRIKYMVALYPALSDLTGYLNGRAGGWPHIFNTGNAAIYATPIKVETSKYYDVVNFAKLIKIPGFYSWGYNDETCPPTSFYAAYNCINAPKELFLAQETGHWTFPEQMAKVNEWLVDKLILKK
ncbi:MAG: acetylxylan esterase [Flavobacteriales bacterium]|nr:MAG: acetylxylan esterase [Flavobacteriales bacterium]